MLSSTLLSGYLSVIIKIVISVLGTLALGWLSSHVKGLNMTKAKGLALTAVKFAEELGSSLGLTGPEKYARALDWIQTYAPAVGIKLSTAQWQGLIISALGDLKKEWGIITSAKTTPSTSTTPTTTTSTPSAPATTTTPTAQG